MSKSLLAKYYQDNKERLQKKSVKDIKIFLKRKKQKQKQKHGWHWYKKLSEDLKKGWLSIKKYYKMKKKSPIIIIKNRIFLI